MTPYTYKALSIYRVQGKVYFSVLNPHGEMEREELSKLVTATPAKFGHVETTITGVETFMHGGPIRPHEPIGLRTPLTEIPKWP